MVSDCGGDVCETEGEVEVVAVIVNGREWHRDGRDGWRKTLLKGDAEVSITLLDSMAK